MVRFDPNPRAWLVLAAAIVALAAAPAARASRPLLVGFDASGLSKLSWQGGASADFLVSGGVELQDLKLNGGNAGGGDFSVTSSRFDSASRTLVQRYPWGTVRVGYHPDPLAGVLHTAITVSNTGGRSITRLGLFLLRWRLPSAPINGWNGADRLLHDREDDFPIISVAWNGGKFAVCSDDVATPATFGIQPLDKGAQAVTLFFSGESAIAPGEQRQVALSMRFAPSSKSTKAFVGDVLKAYAARYPSELNWPDHRPIGSTFLSTSVAGYKHNPRGWFMNPDLDVTTSAGRAAFASELWSYSDAVISHCRQLNAQGVIVWDIEGQEMPHATSYLADPRMLSQVAPEMEPLADRLFRKFSSAGLRTGVTIRPTRVVKNDKGPGWMQQDVSDWVAEMDAKITYAQKRWGCTLFYLDSNVTYVLDKDGKIIDNPTMPADYFRTLAEHHPDCLLMPEHKTSRYWAYTAPYSEFRLGFKGTPEEVRIAYPHAFSVMQVVDGPSLSDPDSVKTLTADIDHGDILLFRPWWDDPQTTDIEHLYAQGRPQLRQQ